MTVAPKDVKGQDLNVGDFVCYTTNSRGSGLSFGRIRTIKHVPVMRRDGTVRHDYKIVVDSTDVDGNTQFREEFDYAVRTYMPTDKPMRSGYIDHSEDKFLRL